jgi:tripartite-type tricarboxylate transporter receptor subunit TctC
MFTRIVSVCVAVLLSAAGGADAADRGSSFPNRPIRIVVGFTPGGQPDITARLLGPKLTEALGQQVIVDNRPGAGGVFGARIVAQSNPDGHTLLSVSAAHVAAPTVHAKLGYDPARDFAGVTQTLSAAYLLVVSPSVQAKSVKDLIALAKAKPGQINFASGSTGSGTHFAAEMFKHSAGIDVVHIPFKGVPEALTDTVAGRTHFFMAPLASSISLVRDGKLRALGVSSEKRIGAHPDIPTIAEAALPGFRWDSWAGILAPAKTPRAVIDRLNHEITRALKMPDVAQKLIATGAEPTPSSPAEFEKLVLEQLKVAAQLARNAGIKPE